MSSRWRVKRLSIARVSWCRHNISFPCATSRNDAVALTGSNANSSVPGVTDGVGGLILTSDRIEEPFVEFDRWRAGPVLILGGLRVNCSVSRCRDHECATGASRQGLLSIMDDRSTIKGFQKSDMKLENVRTHCYCALESSALLEKSTAARGRYVRPRLDQQGSELAVRQICMRSLGS